ncbi:MAG: hypothetical protein M0Z80_11030 [Treponema sp.]|nr:hypothetical protein [Treponema sp.]
MSLISCLNALRRLGTFLGAAAILLGGSALIVWPLWYLAAERRAIFNYGLAALVVLGALYAISRAALRRKGRRGSVRRTAASGR